MSSSTGPAESRAAAARPHLCGPVLWRRLAAAGAVCHCQVEALQEAAQVHRVGPPQRQLARLRALRHHARGELAQRQRAKGQAVLSRGRQNRTGVRACVQRVACTVARCDVTGSSKHPASSNSAARRAAAPRTWRPRQTSVRAMRRAGACTTRIGERPGSSWRCAAWMAASVAADISSSSCTSARSGSAVSQCSCACASAGKCRQAARPSSKAQAVPAVFTCSEVTSSSCGSTGATSARSVCVCLQCAKRRRGNTQQRQQMLS